MHTMNSALTICKSIPGKCSMVTTCDAAFASLLGQDIDWHDQFSPNALISRLSDDATLFRPFAGEVRSFTASIARVAVGIIVSYSLASLLRMAPSTAFVGNSPIFVGAACGGGRQNLLTSEKDMQIYYGEDEGDAAKIDASSPGAIVLKMLPTFAPCLTKYARALEQEDLHPMKTSIIAVCGIL